jgi:hypothetical protein
MIGVKSFEQLSKGDNRHWLDVKDTRLLYGYDG